MKTPKNLNVLQEKFLQHLNDDLGADEEEKNSNLNTPQILPSSKYSQFLEKDSNLAYVTSVTTKGTNHYMIMPRFLATFK